MIYNQNLALWDNNQFQKIYYTNYDKKIDYDMSYDLYNHYDNCDDYDDYDDYEI